MVKGYLNFSSNLISLLLANLRPCCKITSFILWSPPNNNDLISLFHILSRAIFYLKDNASCLSPGSPFKRFPGAQNLCALSLSPRRSLALSLAPLLKSKRNGRRTVRRAFQRGLCALALCVLSFPSIFSGHPESRAGEGGEGEGDRRLLFMCCRPSSALTIDLSLKAMSQRAGGHMPMTECPFQAGLCPERSQKRACFFAEEGLLKR